MEDPPSPNGAFDGGLHLEEPPSPNLALRDGGRHFDDPPSPRTAIEQQQAPIVTFAMFLQTASSDSSSVRF